METNQPRWMSISEIVSMDLKVLISFQNNLRYRITMERMLLHLKVCFLKKTNMYPSTKTSRWKELLRITSVILRKKCRPL
jgi:hypothetical protein